MLGTGRKAQITRGAHEGCVLSPLLFNVYVEEIVQIAIKNISYTDDTTIFVDKLEDFQELLKNVDRIKYLAAQKSILMKQTL